MKIKDLHEPIVASKADWLPGDDWLGFTPQAKGSHAAAKCQSTIQRQSAKGYVLEYVTEGMEKPNSGFESNEKFLSDKKNHEIYKGRLIAVHKLKFTSRPLSQIIGKDENDELQSMWKKATGNDRWSVAFPIIDSYSIDGLPKAKEVFGRDLYNSLYKHPSAILRPLSDKHYEKLMELEISPRPVDNYWIAVADEIKFAEMSDLNSKHLNNFTKHLQYGAREGESEESRKKIVKRAAWLANSFVKYRKKSGILECDDCKFDPSDLFDHQKYNPRSLLDVHHKNPIAEGKRYTHFSDLALLCPTCHRREHVRLRLGL